MNEENETEYSVLVKRCYEGRDNDNYPKTYVTNNYLISADSLNNLYERMAKEYVDWKLEGEKRIKVTPSWSDDPHNLDGYFVKFGDIHIIVEEYSEDKMKATETYKNKAAARDKFLVEQKILEETKRKSEEERARIWREKQEREEYLRLKKKFEKSS